MTFWLKTISSPAKFSLQLDETTDDASLSQIAVFVRYVKEDVMQGSGVNIIEAEEHLKAFEKKSNYRNDKQRMITSLIFL